MNQQIEHCYIHIPYCQKKCPYCSFFSVAYEPDFIDKYCRLVQNELEILQTNWNILPKTIYLGGGTPSILEVHQIQSILERFDDSNSEEITIEVNPIHLTEKCIQGISETKINRISIGAQSFLDKELMLLGRLHREIHTTNGFHLLRKYHFDNLSLDIIYGLPNQTLADLEVTIEHVLSLNPEHISLYCLSLDESVPLFKKKKQIPSDETVAEMYNFIRYRLTDSDYIQYEISNFSKAGYQSKHNLCYWQHKEYIGLGAGASGFISNFRYQNHNNLKQYQSMVLSEKIFAQRELLSKHTLEKEFIFLQLRKTNGLSLQEFEQKFGHSFAKTYEKQINLLINEKLADFINERFMLLPEAYFISDEIFSQFF